MQPEESPQISYETLRSLSTIEIKEILHKKQIDSVGVYDKETLINLALGRKPETDFSSQLPESYLSLFELETKRKNEANERIREYLKRERTKQPREPKPLPRKKQDDRAIATVVENMPAKYKEEEILKFLSRAGEVETVKLHEINDTTINPRLQTRTVIVQYKTKQSAKKCKELFHGLEVTRGIHLVVMRETRLEKPVKSIAKEIDDLSAVPLNVVVLYNMFTEENAKDREYMQDVRGDVEAQCSEYGTITGLAIDEQTRVVRVRYASEQEAMKCKEALDGHVYDGRRMAVELERDPTPAPAPKQPEDDLLSGFLESIAEEEAKFKSESL